MINIHLIRDIVVPYLNNHNLATRRIFINDNVRPLISCFVSDPIRQEAIDTIHRPPMSTDMNPSEHVWDNIGKKINRVQAFLNVQDLRAALIKE